MLEDARRPATLRELLRKHERLVILETLRRNRFSRERTAEILGLSLPTLWRRMRDLEITAADAPVVKKKFLVDTASAKK